MRDLSRASGMSLAGLYYYFPSKSELYYLIQKNLWTSVLRSLQDGFRHLSQNPEDRFHFFVRNHIEFFLTKPIATQRLTRDTKLLGLEHATEILDLQTRYYHGCMNLIDVLRREKRLGGSSRVAAQSLFGILDSLHNWYDPAVDGSPRVLAGAISNIFLQGIYFD